VNLPRTFVREGRDRGDLDGAMTLLRAYDGFVAKEVARCQPARR